MVVERRFRLDADISFANYARSQDYRLLGRKGEGTFSEVLKCQSLRDGAYYACKRLKQRYDSQESVNGLREVQAMRRLGSHPNIVQLHEVLYDKKSGTLALICELMDMNMYELIRDRRNFLPEGRIRSYMQQLCRSLDYMHRNGIFHRDVKPENILIKQNEVLKLADFGSCKSAFARPPFTEYISTRWYRAPECLLTDGHYGLAMDVWSAGCVFYEITSLQPLFPGANEVDQISKIHEVLGTPTAALLNKMRSKSRGLGLEFPSQKGLGLSRLVPHASAEATQLMAAMLTYDPEERLSAKAALRHAFFTGVRSASQPAQIGDPERHPMGVYGPLSPLGLKEDPPAKAASLPWISAAKPIPRRKRFQAQGGLAVPVSHPRGGGGPPESSFSSASAFHGLPLSRLRVGGVAPPLRLPPLPPLHASGSGIHLSTLQAQARKAEHAERLGIHYPLPSMARRGGKYH
ncbi:MAPK/MAK/MRK overlapping kinase isoform X3 [Lethenteron reissneri]|uniref:MAPK/MAK/MRK overlapping kinase isoform X3 n=1 Tax=Lethenteron reissneri TaxID=7753 RepID=UPI002AB77484|nr:MAPK/MAK/MRK overlapping kinase isoform X3 [Lethenteron reissneri]